MHGFQRLKSLPIVESAHLIGLLLFPDVGSLAQSIRQGCLAYQVATGCEGNTGSEKRRPFDCESLWIHRWSVK